MKDSQQQQQINNTNTTKKHRKTTFKKKKVLDMAPRNGTSIIRTATFQRWFLPMLVGLGIGLAFNQNLAAFQVQPTMDYGFYSQHETVTRDQIPVGVVQLDVVSTPELSSGQGGDGGDVVVHRCDGGKEFMTIERKYKHTMLCETPSDTYLEKKQQQQAVQVNDKFSLHVVYFVNCKIHNGYGGWMEYQLRYVPDDASLTIVAVATDCQNEPILHGQYNKVRDDRRLKGGITLLECHNEADDVPTFEYYGIRALWEFGQNNPHSNSIAFYFHSKGLTHFKTFDDYQRKDYFASNLTKNTLGQVDRVLEAFDLFPHINKAGAKTAGGGFVWYNFWFARGSYLSTVVEPIRTHRRHYYEDWLARSTSSPRGGNRPNIAGMGSCNTNKMDGYNILLPEFDKRMYPPEVLNMGVYHFPNLDTWSTCEATGRRRHIAGRKQHETFEDVEKEKIPPIVSEDIAPSPSPPRPKKKIILLAGPHKSLSTTLQSIALTYSNINDDMLPWHYVSEPYPGGFGGAKAFANFVRSYYNLPFGKDNVRLDWRMVKRLYQAEVLENFYDKGLNIILGSEEIDRITTQRGSVKYNNSNHRNGDLIDEILRILPVQDHRIHQIETELEVVIVHRTPWFTKIKSLYKELKRGFNGTLYEFLSIPSKHEEDLTFKGQFYAIDSLELTSNLLRRGMKVKLIDLVGVETAIAANIKEELGIHSVLGCNIMKLRCDGDMTMPEAVSAIDDGNESPSTKAALIDKLTEKSNIKRVEEELLNVSDKQKDEIETLLLRYDCGRRHILHSPNLEILFGTNLVANLEACAEDKAIASREALFAAIDQVFVS